MSAPTSSMSAVTKAVMGENERVQQVEVLSSVDDLYGGVRVNMEHHPMDSKAFATVGSRVNLIRAQRTLAGLEAQKTLQAQHLRGRKTGDSNSRPPRPPGLRLSNSRLLVRDLLRRQWARIRGLRDLRFLGPRIRGPMPET
jgi:hypothetical protein